MTTSPNTRTSSTASTSILTRRRLRLSNDLTVLVAANPRYATGSVALHNATTQRLSDQDRKTLATFFRRVPHLQELVVEGGTTRTPCTLPMAVLTDILATVVELKTIAVSPNVQLFGPHSEFQEFAALVQQPSCAQMEKFFLGNVQCLPTVFNRVIEDITGALLTLSKLKSVFLCNRRLVPVQEGVVRNVAQLLRTVQELHVPLLIFPQRCIGQLLQEATLGNLELLGICFERTAAAQAGATGQAVRDMLQANPKLETLTLGFLGRRPRVNPNNHNNNDEEEEDLSLSIVNAVAGNDSVNNNSQPSPVKSFTFHGMALTAAAEQALVHHLQTGNYNLQEATYYSSDRQKGPSSEKESGRQVQSLIQLNKAGRKRLFGINSKSATRKDWVDVLAECSTAKTLNGIYYVLSRNPELVCSLCEHHHHHHHHHHTSKRKASSTTAESPPRRTSLYRSAKYARHCY